MARPTAKQGAWASGRFSNREIVGGEHSSRSDGVRSSAILNIEDWSERIGVVAVLIAGCYHHK